MIPSKKQWKNWSLVSKYTAAGFFITLVGLVIAVVTLYIEKIQFAEERKTHLIEKVTIYSDWEKQNLKLVSQYEVRLLELERQNYERLYTETKQALEAQRQLTDEIREDKLRAEEQLEIMKIELEKANNLLRRLFKFLLRLTSEEFRSRENHNNEIMKLLPQLKDNFTQSMEKIKDLESEYLGLASKYDSLRPKIDAIGKQVIQAVSDSTLEHKVRLDSLSKKISKFLK